jgi:hypothetical protein
MDGLRAGRIWVDHGRLIKSLDARVRVAGDRRASSGTPLGVSCTPAAAPRPN